MLKLFFSLFFLFGNFAFGNSAFTDDAETFFPATRKLLINPIPEEAVVQFEERLNGKWRMPCFHYSSESNYELTMQYANGELIQTFYTYAPDDTNCAGTSETTVSRWKYYLYLPQNNKTAIEPFDTENPPTAWSIFLELIDGSSHGPSSYWDLVKIENGQLTLSAEAGAQEIPQTYYHESFVKDE